MAGKRGPSLGGVESSEEAGGYAARVVCAFSAVGAVAQAEAVGP